MRDRLRFFLLALATLTAPLAAQTISYVSVPTVVPRDTGIGPYSPLVVIQYAGLGAHHYTVRVHLLETGAYNCGCDSFNGMWCPALFQIDNTSSNNASGIIVDARMTNVYGYNAFQWKAELLLESQEPSVSTATSSATATTNDAPVLTAIGNKSVAVGQDLDFTVLSTDAEGNARSLSAYELPPGASFTEATGQFHWQPSSLGTSFATFVVTQTGGTPLSDAERISIQVLPATIAFTQASYTTGEGGPDAVLLVSRTTTTGTATVNYSTINGGAIGDSDFMNLTGQTLTIPDGVAVKTLRVPLSNDSSIESNEAFQVALFSPTGATLGSPSTATVTIVDDDSPQLAGQWAAVSTWPTVPIHLHLLPTGKVMFWDQHNHNVFPEWDDTPRLWDPDNPTAFALLPHPGWDLFCSGHAFLADGRLLVAGGHIEKFVGEPKAGIYDPFASSWTALPNMNAGRWYPTNTCLANGELLVVAGTRTNYGDTNPLPQVLQANQTWRDLTNAITGGWPAWPDFYPFMYQAPDGRVFVAGPQQTSRYLDPTGTGAWTSVANSAVLYRDYGSSVLYDTGKVLIVGGNPRELNDLVTPTIIPGATAEVIDLSAPAPAWRTVAPMSVGRRHLNTTLLPDGRVLVTGGSSEPGADTWSGKVLYAEMWDPIAETWTPLSAHTKYRGYHSNALLLPDGRVLVAGGGHPNPVGGLAENNAEIYSPPYLFKPGTRPAITSAPAEVTYGQSFPVSTPDAASITSVTWIRLGSVTHAFNQNQRINRLSFTASSGVLNVTAPATANLCPPGHYMLFILNADGVPSIAKIMRINLSSLRIDAVAPIVGRTDGGQQIHLTGAFAELSTVKMGGVAANWTFSNGTSEIEVTTPSHPSIGVVSIDLTASATSPYSKSGAFAFLPTAFPPDNTLTPLVTRTKAEHISQIRQAIDVLRAIARLSPAQWTDPVLVALATPVKAVHVAELRSRLEEAATQLGLQSSQYTDSPLSAGSLIKAVHIEELRQRIRDIAG